LEKKNETKKTLTWINNFKWGTDVGEYNIWSWT
jgi:hypothetical protein